VILDTNHSIPFEKGNYANFTLEQQLQTTFRQIRASVVQNRNKLGNSHFTRKE